MTSGSLQGSRHSWAEFYVDGLGWVPVDLTFQYFGAFPHTSHVVESYGDQSIKVNYSGGSLGASWSNSIL
jgi:transglutaminase-like putative cysteine protease